MSGRWRSRREETKKTEYSPSETVRAAQAAADAQKESRPDAYRSAWEQQLQEAMGRILNREDFHYNLNGDALYQQYREQAVRNGRLAMMDTMGQAAALTGGYGNSYAQSVGQQAYQQQLQSLNDRIPELYMLALEQYRTQGQNQLDRYGLLRDREDQDYSRYRDSLAAWQKDADRLWNVYANERDFDYGTYRNMVTDQQWQAEFNEAKRRYDQEWEAAHMIAEEAEPEVVYVSAGNAAAKTESESKSSKKKTLQTPKSVTL